MNSGDFVEDFMSECIDKGISSHKAIGEVAYNEILEIDKKLRESNLLRIRYKNLKLVLKEVNHVSLNRLKNTQIQIYSNISDIKDSAYYDVLIDICNFIDNNNEIITSREIMDSVGLIEDSQIIFSCIKTLSDNGIIVKNSERHILKGPKWSDRPTTALDNPA